MCGITGIFNLNSEPVSQDLLNRMSRELSHRGPDDEGVCVWGNIGFGHRRLSIIDLSERGRQPMSNEDGTVWITYNGEIYNHLALREELQKKAISTGLGPTLRPSSTFMKRREPDVWNTLTESLPFPSGTPIRKPYFAPGTA